MLSLPRELKDTPAIMGLDCESAIELNVTHDAYENTEKPPRELKDTPAIIALVREYAIEIKLTTRGA